MRVCYQILTHRSPEQVHRLVAALAETSRDPLVLVDHDRNGPPLRAEVWEGDARVVVRSSAGGYGGWTHLARYFDNIELLESLGLAYDWMVTISGQDYPIRP
ncbi:MAG: beta-1,6-N-acetylglucosaminyltransferase, partial [Acidimicrobiales bacterium]